MPAPQKSVLSQLCKTNFIAKGIKLPVDWSTPGEQYDDAFDAAEKQVVPNSPMNLFVQASLNKYHVDAAKQVNDVLDAYIEGICGAICSGIDQWLKAASIAGVVVNGPVGVLAPGNVIGSPLAGLILGAAPMNTAQEQKFSNAIANALGVGWQSWSAGLGGVLSYPLFAAFPGPLAPPTPNVPVPLLTMASPGEAQLTPAALHGAMQANLADPTAMHASELFDALATAFANVFQIFKSTTMVQNVLGTGPVPTFAPPAAPVGPVVGGTGNGAPGCIL